MTRTTIKKQHGFLELIMSSGFQRQGFRIPQAKVSRIPDSRLPYMGRIGTKFYWLRDLGVGGGLGLNRVKFSRSSLWMLLQWNDPPNSFWWLSRSPPPCLHFPSKFEWSPLWILPKFSAIPPFGFSVTSDSPFCSPKIKWSALKFSAPPPRR